MTHHLTVHSFTSTCRTTPQHAKIQISGFIARATKIDNLLPRHTHAHNPDEIAHPPNTRSRKKTPLPNLESKIIGRGKNITPKEAMYILALADENEDVATICRVTKCSETAVRKVIKQ